MDKELYDELCRALTWFEHPQECPFGEEEAATCLYEVAVKIQNEFAP